MPDTTRDADVTTAFAELVCADPAWLHAEFEAIVSAGFGTPPSPPPAPRHRAGGNPPRPAPASRAAVATPRPSRLTAAPAALRQRSPPPDDHRSRLSRRFPSCPVAGGGGAHIP